MSLKTRLISMLFASLVCLACQPNAMNPLEEIMSLDHPKIKAIAQNLEKHEVQILYTQIERDSKKMPHFINHEFQVDDNFYFYPSSTAKLPVAILALQKVRALQNKGVSISIDDRFVVENLQGEVIFDRDSTAQNGFPSIRHMIKKIFLVSDNDAYNYLFDFLGRDYVNQELRNKNMGAVHINHKFLTGADNKNTWNFSFYNNENQLTYSQASIASDVAAHGLNLQGLQKGKGYINECGNLIQEPFDFSKKNYVSLRSLQKIIRSIIFPESLPVAERFDITSEDHELLKYWMSRNTLESDYPSYDSDEFYESYVKFFLFGDSKAPIPRHIRSYNKVGNAYGTLTEVAYIHDDKNHIEFMLTATIQVNENQIFNDGIYAYDSLGYPFMAELGRQVYQHEFKNRID